MGTLNPGHIRVLFVDPTGRMMLFVAGGMQILGSVGSCGKIVKIDALTGVF